MAALVELITGSVFQSAFGISQPSLPPLPPPPSPSPRADLAEGEVLIVAIELCAFLPVSEPLLQWLKELALVILGAVHPSRLLLMAPPHRPPSHTQPQIVFHVMPC